ncbi:hypothetical protein Cantr_06019 [Candida viswanathii]|uniref:Uncharacterized protein n=1 Tax=Candida viswanathii TaxID=5486 RepID=A0A367XQQ1_9ASCO|nr:hypothetical protein Cantr_06019 [Candida viswanathii]
MSSNLTGSTAVSEPEPVRKLGDSVLENRNEQPPTDQRFVRRRLTYPELRFGDPDLDEIGE